MTWADVVEASVNRIAEIIVILLLIFLVTSPMWFLLAIVWLQ